MEILVMSSHTDNRVHNRMSPLAHRASDHYIASVNCLKERLQI
jgi:hypothetical protein